MAEEPNIQSFQKGPQTTPVPLAASASAISVQPVAAPPAPPGNAIPKQQLPVQGDFSAVARMKRWIIARPIGGVAALVFAFVCLGIVALVWVYPRLLVDTPDNRAKMGIRTIEQAVQTFKVNNGHYPASLEDLTVRQPNNSPALLKPQAIIDPWNQPYQYEQRDRRGVLFPHIYSLGEPGKDQIINNLD
jgi:hypothetical protein